ncbi:MAG: sigma-70 family RNA polymerase sigma factor [Desulfobacula sp.]|nr:sigma-70 family RNA polymerase sigma factor [Desulfobacula sp.]MBT6337970.1 sigma-70 family RNA polymerase sigma factor [Desulfobacula sp.]
MNKLEANTENIDEQDLVERLQKGQQWAFNILVNTYQNRLLKIAYGITLDREDSMEIVQDVFISVFKNIRTFRQESSLATWLRKITINHCLNWKRKWKRRFKWDHKSIDSENSKNLFKENNNPEMLYREKQSEKNIMTAIKKLPEKIRLVFVLNVLEGLSYEEISETLNIRKGTVSSRLHFARKNLINFLELSD